MERIQNVHPKEYNGRKFRSTLEADTAKMLDLLGLPWEYEPRKIMLLEGFRSRHQKDKVQAITYTPDFILGNIMLECKGFETPEWKMKRKLVLKYLEENEPNMHFHQIHNCRKDLLEVLDNYWTDFGYAVHVTSKIRKNPRTWKFASIQEAMTALGMGRRSKTYIMKSLTGEKEYVYNYNWKLIKITL